MTNDSTFYDLRFFDLETGLEIHYSVGLPPRFEEILILNHSSDERRAGPTDWIDRVIVRYICAIGNGFHIFIERLGL